MIDVESAATPSAAEAAVEVVEHKGIGHPDTICDALAEAASRALSQLYLGRFGTILHHNVDKALLVGGISRPRFGGGELLEPIEITLAGRASLVEDVDFGDLLRATSHQWFRTHMHAVDFDRHVRFAARVRPGSEVLRSVFDEGANDTSFGVGFAPLTALERAVLAAGDRLRYAAADPATAAIGEDYKILGVRRGGTLELTVAAATIGSRLADVDAYVATKKRIVAMLNDAVPGARITVNAADDVANGKVYLTVTGTSADSGDDGQVGRGNRINGLITPMRSMSLEAAAGKNPTRHVGKLYNVAANQIAHAIVDGVEEIGHAEVLLVGTIGQPIDHPTTVSVRVETRDRSPLEPLKQHVRKIVESQLDDIGGLAMRIVRGETRVY